MVPETHDVILFLSSQIKSKEMEVQKLHEQIKGLEKAIADFSKQSDKFKKTYESLLYNS